MATRIGKGRTAQIPAITSRPDPKTHLFTNFSNRALRRRDAARMRLRSKRILSKADALFLEGATKVELPFTLAPTFTSEDTHEA